MSDHVAIVTDSTAYLPTDLVTRHGIRVVPLQVVIAGQVRDEGTEVTADDVAHALRSWAPVTTSRPSPQRFADAYGDAARAGARGVVSLHLSARMSGTVEAARHAAKEAEIPVRVVDTDSIAMGMGFGVLSAAEAAEAGTDLDDVAEAARHRANSTRSLFYVDTLEHLRRGGRIGAAATLLGSALMIKPLLHLVNGTIAPLEKVRTTSRALARLEDIAVEEAGDSDVDVAVHHLANAVRAAALAERLRERLPRLRDLYVGEVGAVIGAHVGPGMLAVVVAPR
ncbi:MAG: DegV family EDD domain-containing protein [Streptosporangiales bacterium]|nr:DegV family EDD domain-containing protein [Streptosporangiales bacterium]